MPTSVASVLLVFGAVVTAASAPIGIGFAALGLLFELFVFYTSGSDGAR